MSKATESELSELHGVVAKVLKEQLEATATVLDVDGNEQTIKTVSPAMVAQAIKFLKDNNITSVEELDDDIDQLKDTLSKKSKRGKITYINPEQAAKGKQ